MTEDQIKHMAERFLGWTLPENFAPDAGISFERLSHNRNPYPMPLGTNLLDYTQAVAMVRHMVEGMP